jgi:hypothetical protein
MAKDNAIVKEVDREDANWTNIIDLNFPFSQDFPRPRFESVDPTHMT